MMGKVDDSGVMNAVRYEYETYQDIVQEDFVDSYKNLTYKGLMALKWISVYCPQADYILKVDDDIMVNTFTLINHLKYLDKHEHPNVKASGKIFCLVWGSMEVMRDRFDRLNFNQMDLIFVILALRNGLSVGKSFHWILFHLIVVDRVGVLCFTRIAQHASVSSALAYVLTGDMPKKMFDVSQYIPFFWVDDYYITGAVASAANATYVQFGSLYTILEELAHIRFMSQKSFYTIMFGHLVSVNDSPSD